MWSRTYGTAGNDGLADAVSAHGGGLLLAVNTAADADEGTWLLRTDDAGDVTWKRTYDLGERDVPVALRRVADGYVLAGYGREYDGASRSPWLLRVAPDGEERWRRRYRDSDSRRQLTAMARTPDGGFVLAGSATRYGEDREDVTWLLNADAAGRRQWFRTYGDGFEWLTGVASAPDGGYALVGHSHLETPGGSAIDATLLRTDAEGRERWRRHYGGAESERPQAVCATPTGFVFAGEADSPATPGGLLVAVDRRGRVVWRRVYPDLGVANDLLPLPDGYALLGDRLARTDRRGGLRWSFGDFDLVDPRTTALARTEEGFAAGGVTSYSQDAGMDAWLAGVRTP